MNENLYIAHKKLPHKTLRVHSAKYTQCIHVSSRKLKLPKDMHLNCSLSRVAETVPTGFCSNSTTLRASHQQPRPGEVTMQHLDHFDVHEAASEPVQQDDATTRL